MRKSDGLRCISTGLLVGLGWGLFAALSEGLPLLLQGSLWAFLGERLLALAYLATIYGALCGLAGGLSGLVALVVLRLARRRTSRTALAATLAGLFAAATLVVWWAHRFAPRALEWVVILGLAAGAGLAVGWGLHRVARGGAVSRKAFRSLVLVGFLAAGLAVLAVAGFRAKFRDLPLFNPPTADGAATAEQPNIVLITAGGVRPDRLGVYGSDPAISPNIDALAWRGIRFEQAYAQAAWSEPSLASLLTSLYPSGLGIDCRAAIHCTPHLDAQRTTLAEALQGAGYRTQAYLTSPWLSAELGFDQGFDGFESIRPEEPFDLGPMRSQTLGRLLGCRQDSTACQRFSEGHARLFDAPIPLGWGGDHVNARVTRFLDLYGGERFFLWVHYTEALPPYNLEPPFRPLPGDPMSSPERRLKKLGYWELGDPYTPREELLPRDVESLLALYDAEVHRVDRLVGGLSGLLEAYGLTERTIVVFTADHGQEFMEHGGYTYGHSLHDEVLRVPLIFAGPGDEVRGQVVATAVGLLDLTPTLLEIAGASAPSEIEGRSLLPALQGEPLAERPIFSEGLYRIPHELKAMRQNGYKLIYHADADTFELYDVTTDPAEQRDVSAQATHVAERMARDLLDWMAHTAQVAQELPRAAPPTEFRDAVW